jgi:pimeloyl-ACP methyl ester carboxylesterase/DNA-binding CsgD family transcriptional regulator
MNPPLQYAKTRDGVSIAFIRIGRGRPIVFASNIFGDAHLYLFGIPHVREVADRLMNSGWSVVCYDIRGMGSSDRDITDLSLTARVCDLEAVVERLGLAEFAVGGVDLGAATAVAYSVSHPEQVSRLVLVSPWASAKAKFALPDFKVVRGMSPQADREWQVFTNSLSDVATGFEQPNLRRQFAEAMRQGTTADGLFAYYNASEHIDVTPLLANLDVPTLVLYDAAFPFGSFELCRDVAAKIRNSKLVVLDSRTIAGISQESYVREFSDFLRDSEAVDQVTSKMPLSTREVEVLRLLASGRSNQQIADELVISLNTVNRHVSNIYSKTGAANRAEAASYATRQGIV